MYSYSYIMYFYIYVFLLLCMFRSEYLFHCVLCNFFMFASCIGHKHFIIQQMHNYIIHIRGSFQNFCTLYVFSSKMNSFYKIHLQAFSVISIVLYHSGPTFGKVLYSCQ